MFPVNPCVVLAVDPGKESGWALYLPEYRARVGWGQVAEDDAAGRLQVMQEARALAHSRIGLPLVIAREKWSAGGPNATPAMFAGLGASWGWWQEAYRLATQLDDEERLLRVLFVQFFTQTWWSGVMGGRKPARDAALAQVRAYVDRVYRTGERHGPDEAVASCIGEHAQRSKDVAKVIPKEAWLAKGEWLRRP